VFAAAAAHMQSEGCVAVDADASAPDFESPRARRNREENAHGGIAGDGIAAHGGIAGAVLQPTSKAMPSTRKAAPTSKALPALKERPTKFGYLFRSSILGSDGPAVSRTPQPPPLAMASRFQYNYSGRYVDDSYYELFEQHSTLSSITAAATTAAGD
jgi:hypothetical protein